MARGRSQPDQGEPFGHRLELLCGLHRQQENQQLGIPREVAKTFSTRLRQLVGYGIYRHLIGHIDKRNPDYLLGESGKLESVWDRKSGSKE